MTETAAGDALLSVLRDVLDTESLQPDEDFYLSGGHSLMIMGIARRLEKEHQVEIPLQAFWGNSQISALMAACRPAGDPTSATGPGHEPTGR